MEEEHIFSIVLFFAFDVISLLIVVTLSSPSLSMQRWYNISVLDVQCFFIDEDDNKKLH